MIHNASIEQYREPVGAVTKGEEVKLRLFALEGTAVTVELVLYSEDYHKTFSMREKKGFYECIIEMPEKACILWYYFRITEGNYTYYYGARPGRTCGEGIRVEEDVRGFQITVYERGFETPRWLSKGIMYQIFPDRFCRGDRQNTVRGEAYHRKMGRDIYVHKSWEERPLFGPMEGKEFYDPCDFFGGDLEGIKKRLDELKKLGVTCIYLNPIVESSSNHRYNTGDYKKVNPFLGDNEDFRELCEVARRKGIHIILDGVFSHTGADSLYFNKNGNYKSVGAYQSQDSPYYDWYSFDSRGDYKSWWGFRSLPEVNELDERFLSYIITGRNSVLKHWFNLGASGFRLDVADELPDEFIFLMRKTMKKMFKNYALIGEVWEDVTTKESYGVKRKYALGRGLDSTMNYPFKVNCVNFLLGNEDAYAMQQFLLGQQCNYPKPFYYSVMNLLSSHDIPRIRTTLASGMNEMLPSRENQIDYVVTSENDRRGAVLSRLAFAIQFFIPGIPSIYYGDEYGMNGLMDPFNRGPYFKHDTKIYEELKTVSVFRSREKILQTGYALYIGASKNVLAILRFAAGNKDIFGEPCGQGAYLLLVNPGDEEEEIEFDIADHKEGVPEEEHRRLIRMLGNTRVHTKIQKSDYKIMRLS